MVFERKNVKASKLTPTQVMEIKARYGEGATQGALCREFGVSVGQIGRIVRGESWGSVSGAAVSPQQAAASEAAFLQRMQARDAAGPAVKALAEEFAAMPKRELMRSPPPSPLDGADAPSEVDGSALATLESRAAAFGLDIEKLRGGV